MLIMAACNSGGNSSAALVDYAKGHWSCVYIVPSDSNDSDSNDGGTYRYDATITVTSSTRGKVFLAGRDSHRTLLVGEWSLQGDKLTVKLNKRMGTAAAQAVSLSA